MQRICGAGRIYEMKRKRRPHYKPIWQFYVHNFEEVQAIIAMMWTWLTPEKKIQAETALAIYHDERLAKSIKNYARREYAVQVQSPT